MKFSAPGSSCSLWMESVPKAFYGACSSPDPILDHASIAMHSGLVAILGVMAGYPFDQLLGLGVLRAAARPASDTVCGAQASQVQT